jgi:hypothetical protein
MRTGSFAFGDRADAAVQHGIPSVMVDIGNQKGSKEAEIEKEWLAERYHAPSDDLNQPMNKQVDK